jgi:hypothetical protein
VVDTNGYTAWYNSIALVDDYPAIAYYEAFGGDLWYVRALDAEGAAWDDPVSVATTGNTGGYPSLLEVNDKPAIAYYNSTSGDLEYIQAQDDSGATWNEMDIITVDGGNGIGLYSSMIIVQGVPAIGYADQDNEEVRYVLAADADGDTWNSPESIESGTTDDGTSLLLVNGYPAISYILDEELHYCRAGDVSGTTWNSPITLATHANGTGSYSSMVLAESNYPAIAFFGNWTAEDLNYIDANDVTGEGAGWDTVVGADTAGDIGRYLSMCMVRGVPAVSYYDADNFDLCYIAATDDTGASWGSRQVLDSVGSVGPWTSMCVLTNGTPGIAYQDALNGYLKFVTFTP